MQQLDSSYFRLNLFMPHFLHEIITELNIPDTTLYREACFVFPTRRACHHFRQALADAYPGQAFILPEILTIEDFVSRQSGLVIPDELSLLVVLHGIFNKEHPQPFDEFYPWGKMVLRDFQETDKYLVDAGHLYTVLREHREMEEEWALGEEELAAVREFWDNVQQHGETGQKQHFIQTWSLLKSVYAAFRDKLLDSGMGHMGMAYRIVVDQLEQGQAATL
jgi:hypothetical protein